MRVKFYTALSVAAMYASTLCQALDTERTTLYQVQPSNGEVTSLPELLS